MSVIALQSGVANHVAAERPEEARRALASIEEMSRAALQEMRALLGVLRDPDDPARPAPGLALAYLLPQADRIFVIGYQNTQSDTSNAAAMERMVRSFHLLTDQERASRPEL